MQDAFAIGKCGIRALIPSTKDRKCPEDEQKRGKIFVRPEIIA